VVARESKGLTPADPAAEAPRANKTMDVDICRYAPAAGRLNRNGEPQGPQPAGTALPEASSRWVSSRNSSVQCSRVSVVFLDPPVSQIERHGSSSALRFVPTLLQQPELQLRAR
jgi:hypothetical protein